MKRNILYLALALSMLTNIVVLFVFLKGNIMGTRNSENSKENVTLFEDESKRQLAAEKAIRKFICENLYYPDSYDPVSTEVDSAFYNYLTDVECANAAYELIDLRKSYESAKETYDEMVNDIKVFGGSGVFRKITVDRDKAAAEMKKLKPKIDKREAIIKNRDSSLDGRFIGWQVLHRYRASNSNGVVSFGNVVYVLDPHMNQYCVRYSLDEKDDKNLYAIEQVIKDLLGIQVDE